MTRSLIAAASLVLAAPAIAQDPENAQKDAITVNTFEYENDTRALVHEAVIDAPVDRVWSTLSTEEGWKMWGPSEAWFDFRIGGSIETSYVKGSQQGSDQNIVHRILAFVPERMIALRLEQAPSGGFDASVLDGTWGVYELEPIDADQTRLRITGLGYRSDPTSTQILEFFKTGNTYSIEVMKRALAAALRSPQSRGE